MQNPMRYVTPSESTSSPIYKTITGVLLTALLTSLTYHGHTIIKHQEALAAKYEEEKKERIDTQTQVRIATALRGQDLQRIEDLRVEMAKLALLVDDLRTKLIATFGPVPDRTRDTRGGRTFDR